MPLFAIGNLLSSTMDQTGGMMMMYETNEMLAFSCWDI